MLSKQDWTRTAGDGWGSQGFWPVAVPTATIVDLEIVRPSVESDGTASVRFGERIVEGRFPMGRRQVWIRGVELPAGRYPLTAWVNGDESRSAYQVIVHSTVPDADDLTRPVPGT